VNIAKIYMQLPCDFLPEYKIEVSISKKNKSKI
jgi:hypothetical protein